MMNQLFSHILVLEIIRTVFEFITKAAYMPVQKIINPTKPAMMIAIGRFGILLCLLVKHSWERGAVFQDGSGLWMSCFRQVRVVQISSLPSDQIESSFFDMLTPRGGGVKQDN